MSSSPTVAETVARLIALARDAQAVVATYPQSRIDDLVAAAGWAILHPERNRALAEQAVRDTGIGNVDDKIAKNRRKTLGLLRDLQGAISVGVLQHDAARGITEIARPVGVVAAITPSTNPAATPINKVINALKGGNAAVLAPSPKGHATCARLVEFVDAELKKVGAPRGLVQLLPESSKELTAELMRQADWVVATGSQANVRAAYASGTPALGVGAGNVAVIVAEDADLADAAQQIAASKCFDNATSCSSENSLVVPEAIYPALLAALAEVGGALLSSADARRLEGTMFDQGRPRAEFVGQSAERIARLAGLDVPAGVRFLLVAVDGVGPEHPFSGEKISPVLALHRVVDFPAALAKVGEIYAYQGAGHSVGLHSSQPEALAERMAMTLPVCRVIVNQAHAIATGGAFDNGLPFSLSMGCGSWGGNGFSDNLNYRHFLNISRIVRPIAPRPVSEADVLGDWWQRFGR